jgi:hypothetical protein
MAKYRLSEGNFDKFLRFFGIDNSKRPKSVEDIIKNDPKLQSIDRQMAALNDKAGERIRKNPDMLDIFRRAGVEIY